MIALIALAGSAASLTAGVLLLRRNGSAWRVGRLLSAAPHRSLDDAVAAARSGHAASYMRLHGRIDSEEEFPDDDGEPIVFRRRRLQRYLGGRRYATFDDERLAVPFRLSERGVAVGIDADALGDGLVVVPRLSEGVAADLSGDAVPATLPDMPADTPVRLRIDQISSVDHATAAGVPVVSPDGDVVLTSGMGRPLILTTLDPAEAMRVLGAADRRGLITAGGLIVAACIALLVAVVAAIAGR